MSEIGPILVTGARAPVALDIARAFRAAGFETHLADSVQPFAAHALRPAFPIHRLPAPRTEFRSFRAALQALLTTLDIALIIPTCEEVFWLAEAAARDGWTDRLFAPPLELLHRLHSKAMFNAFAAELDIAVPESVVLDSPFSQSDLPFQGEDLVLKPEFSRFATHALVAPCPAQIELVRPTQTRRWVAQRRLRGEEICTWAAVHGGRISAFAAYRPRWRHGHAAAFQMEAVAVNAARAISEKLAKATAMSGHLSFDLIIDTQGRALPIECNPRAVSGLHLFDASSALAHALLGTRTLAEPLPGQLRHMGPAMALLGMPAALWAGQGRALLRDWRQSLDVINRERNAFVTLGCLADATRFTLQAFKAGLSPAAATTADIEWDGEPIP